MREFCSSITELEKRSDTRFPSFLAVFRGSLSRMSWTSAFCSVQIATPSLIGSLSAVALVSFLTLAPILFLAVDCFALVEIPANGVDDDSSGGDAAGPDGDADLDGYCASGYEGCYYSGTDCDDTNWQIYPGVQIATGCTGSDYKTCQSSGSYTSCTTGPLAEGLTNYYVDYGSGNDSTGDGSYNNPFKTFRKFCSFYNDTQADYPSGYIGLAAGRYIYLKGSTDMSDVHKYQDSDPNGAICKIRGVNGTSSNHIVFKQYPGATAKLNPGGSFGNNKGGFVLLQNDYIDVIGMTITGTYGSDGLPVEEGYGHNLERLTIYDNRCEEDNNCTGIKVTSSDYVVIDHSKIYDNYDDQEPAASAPSGAYGNNSGIVYFRGLGNAVRYNQIYYSVDPYANSNVKGNLLKVKHANSTSTYDIRGNRLWYGNTAMQFAGGASLVVTDNFIASSGGGISIEDVGGPAHMISSLIEYNTIIDVPGALSYNPTTAYGSSIGQMTYRYNVARANAASWSSTTGGMFSVDYDGSNTLYTDVIGGGKITLENNCYRNDNQTALTNGFCIYCKNDTYNLGAIYNFSGWQTAGYDTGSYNEALTFNDQWQSTNPNCDDKGWMLGVGSAGITTKGSFNFRQGGRL